MTAPLDGLAAALGQVLARARQEWRRDYDLAIAQHDTLVARLRADIAEHKQRLDATVAERLAALKDGVDGADGHDGEPGKDVDPEIIRAAVAAAVDAAVKALPVPADGHTPTTEELTPIVEDAVRAAVDALPRAKDGENGKSVEPAEVERTITDLVEKAIAGLPPPEPGKNADPEEVRAIIAEFVENAVAQLPPPEPGRSLAPADVADMIAGEVTRAVAALPIPKDGERGKDADPEAVAEMVAAAVAALPTPAPGRDADPMVMAEMVALEVGKLPIPKDGERGPEGPVGKFVPPKAWAKGIHYESAVVAHAGSTYCALRDTADEPPHEDWALVAARGEEGAMPYVGEICGTFDPARKYRKFDLVHQNGSEWRAKRDNPGPLPVEGKVNPNDWALAAKVGKGGQPGPKGNPGHPGLPAPRIKEWLRDGYRAIPMMSDGTTGPALDVREFFELYHGEAR